MEDDNNFKKDSPIPPITADVSNGISGHKNVQKESESGNDNEGKSEKAGENQSAPSPNTGSNINIDQANYSYGTVENQENSANVSHLAKNSGGDNLYFINQSNNSVSQNKIHFTRLYNENYHQQCSGNFLKYINHSLQNLAHKFGKSRILVLNCKDLQNHGEMAAVEQLIFKDKIANDHSVFCKLEREDANLQNILSQFKSHRSTDANEKKMVGQTVLVINELKHNNTIQSDFLRSAVNGGGVADSITSTLSTERLFVIYVCENEWLYKKEVQENAHFALLNISSVHLHLFEKIADHNFFDTMIQLAEVALSEYDWLFDLSTQEKKAKIDDYIANNNLHSELELLINSIDLKERNSLIDLLRNPLYNIVLFTAAYFDNTSIAEFEMLIQLLITDEHNKGGRFTNDEEKNDILFQWDQEGDTILTKCGITRQQMNREFSSYKLNSSTKKKNLRIVFADQYTLKLTRRFTIIKDKILLSKPFLSEAMLEGITTLSFTNANYDLQKYLIDVCLDISYSLDAHGRNQNEMRSTFYCLLYFIVEWDSNLNFCDYIKRYFHQMRNTQEQRSTLSVILTYVCYPERRNNLEHLKILIESTGKQELAIRFRTPQLIAYNYLGNLPMLFNCIDAWNAENGSGKLSISFSYAKCSLLMAFYSTRFKKIYESDLGYQIVKALITDTAIPEQWNSLVNFFFQPSTKSAFTLVFGDTIRSQISSEKQLPNAIQTALHSLYAFVLIQCYYILTILKEKEVPSAENKSIELFPVILIKVKELLITDLRLLQIALNKAIVEYNSLILQCDVYNEKHKELRRVMVAKRDNAREIIKLLIP